jgi:hypothetical protein
MTDKSQIPSGQIDYLKEEFTNKILKDSWDKWYLTVPEDLRRRLSLHDFKRLGDCFKEAFGIRQ